MKIAAASLSIGLLMFADPCWAKKSIPYAKVGNWEIMVDQSLDYGCFMVGSYTRGEIIRIGINKKTKNGYMMIGNKAWSSLEPGKEYKLSLKFDGESPWTGVFRALDLGDGDRTLWGDFTKVNFLKDLGAKQGMTVYYNDKRVTWIPLTGTSAAVRSMAQCQAKVDAIVDETAHSKDPFAGSPRSTDPFGETQPVSDPFRITPREESF